MASSAGAVGVRAPVGVVDVGTCVPSGSSRSVYRVPLAVFCSVRACPR